jgi:hypothetical protein
MSWWAQLDKKRGSRPRAVLMMDGDRATVAARLTTMVALNGVTLSDQDQWMPTGLPQLIGGEWDPRPADEAILGKPNPLVGPAHQQVLQEWWLAVARRANMPNWDIASTCTIQGTPGLLLVEAKAHFKELGHASKSKPGSDDSKLNHDRIGKAIDEACGAWQSTTNLPWGLSRDSHYQLSNRFAWAWKLATMGIPVVLVYLGFVNATDMADNRTLIGSADEWKRGMKAHAAGVVPDAIWESRADFNGVPVIPLLRAFHQPLPPHHPITPE